MSTPFGFNTLSNTLFCTYEITCLGLFKALHQCYFITDYWLRNCLNRKMPCLLEDIAIMLSTLYVLQESAWFFQALCVRTLNQGERLRGFTIYINDYTPTLPITRSTCISETWSFSHVSGKSGIGDKWTVSGSLFLMDAAFARIFFYGTSPECLKRRTTGEASRRFFLISAERLTVPSWV